MKRLFTIVWLLICLTPIGVAAEEPVKAPAGKFLALALSPNKEMPMVRYEISLPEWKKEGWKEEGKRRLSDEELDSVVATGFDAPPSEEKKYFSRIILWDEVSGKPNNIGAITVKTSGR